VLAVNRMFTEVSGYTAEEVVGKEPVFLRPDFTQKKFYERLWETVNSEGHWVGEISSRRRNGEAFPAWLAISAIRDENGMVTHYTSILTDISARKEAEERIHFLIHHDALTGLPNRFMLKDHIGLAIAHARRNQAMVAVMAVNLDRFRDINERYGHHTGDQLLQTVALRLAGQLREEDTVARIGADNFMVVMPDISDRRQAEAVVVKVLETIGRPVRQDGFEFHVMVRLGVALYPADGRQPDDLMKNADVAMAAAKGSGRAFQFYNQEQSRELEENLALESALRHAIERQELELHYQPRMDLVSGEIVGVEGLLRWKHAEKGLLVPAAFIAIAERSGLILSIGEWVFWQACRQARAWHEAGFPKLHVSVNVSVLQLRQSNLADVVRHVLEETGLNPNCLELEFTETFLMENEERTGVLLRQMKELGVRFAIDDFGTGYSSLAYLKQFPIDVLKIDQSFVRDIAFDAADAAIVQGMIALGHSLKLRMVAEGVETEEQLGYLRSIHCDEMQGYLYSHPLPADEMLRLLQSNRRLQDISSSPGVVRKLLLVDDEPNIAMALKRLLRREGYQILTAASGREALEILAVNTDVGVVVSDQRMPEMSGIELLSKVKVLYPHMVRIVLSGYTELNSVTEAINKGEIYRFLTKPWEDDVLKDVIREAFLRHDLARSTAQPQGGGGA
jgi:diguanylate cyclase (GGDEF)-like protein/PAS domain S-box-containing protein